MVEAEELFDLIFYRPLAFLFVKSVYKTKITPNQVTWLALLVGVIGALYFMKGTAEAFFLGAILLIIYDVLDCSDGQLARLNHNGTLTGRIVDGFADYIVTITAYIGIGIGFANQSDNPVFYWILTVLAGITHAVHSGAVDYYRNQILDNALGRRAVLGEDLKLFEEAYARLQENGTRSFDRLLIWIYIRYSRIQIRFSTDNANKSQSTIYDGQDYFRKNKGIFHLWSYLGPTSELTFIIICALINRWDVFFIGMIGFANLYALTLFIFQNRINKTVKTAEVS